MLLSATWLPPRPLLPPPASNLQPAACALPPGSLNGTILPVTSAPSRLHRNFCPIGQSESLEGAGEGGWEERGVGGVGVRGEARGLVCGAARAPPGLSVPAPAAARPSRRRAHTQRTPRTPHTLAPLLTHTHTLSLAEQEPLTILQVPGPAAAQWVQTLRVPIRGFRLGDDDEGRRWARTRTRRGALVGPPSWQSRLPGRARASAESRIKRSGRNRSARRMGTPLFPAL